MSDIERQEHLYGLPVDVAMEGYNGWARPLDSQVQKHGYQLYNVNTLKLARFKEIFPAPAKSDPIDAHKILELFQLQDHLPLAKGVLQAVLPVPDANRRLKRLTRRHRQLINEKVALQNRIQPELHATCPTLLDITGGVKCISNNAGSLVYGYTSDSDIVKNHKSKTRPPRFTLKFSLADKAIDPESYGERFAKATCDGALIGIGLQGRIAFNFNREEDSTLSAVCSEIKNIRNVLPDATLMGASPAMFAAYAFDTYND
ncbi:IS110 family transposase [Methyloprofundus sp.]|uniref:IS110 family transposase n=1 Tax=Methyloprofundus sp. TaxID=2020875 RepID=UPI003D0EA902